jgi:hypothetical protein
VLTKFIFGQENTCLTMHAGNMEYVCLDIGHIVEIVLYNFFPFKRKALLDHGHAREGHC